MLAQNKVGASARQKARRTRGRPSLRQVADIERELLDVALNVFLEHGYGGTSMATVVKVAGVSKTTLYSRYSSKEDLFLGIIRKVFESNRIAECIKESHSSLSLEEGLKAYALRSLEIGSNSIVMGIDRLIYSEGHHLPELGLVSGKLFDEIIETLRDFVADRVQSEGIACKDPAALAEAVVDLTRGYHVRSMISNRMPSSDEAKAWVDRSIGVLLAPIKG